MQSLIDDTKCFETIRSLRWPDGIHRPVCNSSEVSKQGRDDTQPHRQRYRCTACDRRFDDLTDTTLAGYHRPLRVWMLCLYRRASTSQTAKSRRSWIERGRRTADDGHLRAGMVGRNRRPPSWTRRGARGPHRGGSQGQPRGGGKKAVAADVVGSRASAGRGTRATEKPPILGMIQRGGEVVHSHAG